MNRNELTQQFFNEFSKQAMSSRSDVAVRMTSLAPLAFQFKAFDVLEERRVEIYVEQTGSLKLRVALSKIEAANGELQQSVSYGLTEKTFDLVVEKSKAYFDKEM